MDSSLFYKFIFRQAQQKCVLIATAFAMKVILAVALVIFVNCADHPCRISCHDRASLDRSGYYRTRRDQSTIPYRNPWHYQSMRAYVDPIAYYNLAKTIKIWMGSSYRITPPCVNILQSVSWQLFPTVIRYGSLLQCPLPIRLFSPMLTPMWRAYLRGSAKYCQYICFNFVNIGF